MRQLVLDTETTGLDHQNGHRIIEIGCVELINRRITDQRFHCYLNPERDIDEGAIEVHGIRNEDLIDKPLFADMADAFLNFIKDAELVIHNAPFDVGFINMEFEKCGMTSLENHCRIIDTLVLARDKHPGQKNNLDALCRRYEVDNSQRSQHGALLDAEILSEVYLAMTGGQASLSFDDMYSEQGKDKIVRLPKDRAALPIIEATTDELNRHREYLDIVDAYSNGHCLWKQSSMKKNIQ